MRLVPIVALLVLAASSPPAVSARPPSADSLPPLRAVRATSHIVVDGVLDDDAWRTAPAWDHLIQTDPYEGAMPTESTWVWAAYDEHAVYFAVRCWDAHPESVFANLTRRDVAVANIPNDRVTVNLDPLHDHRDGYFFSLSAAGTLFDGTMANDGATPDGSWDGVWAGRARRDARGWTCEMRIPFSQLRYRPGRSPVWGINVRRRVERRGEVDQMARIPQTGSGYASRFPHLVGLEVPSRAHAVEVVPYVTGKAEYLVHDPADPFLDGARATPGLGGDLRVGVGGSLTLNATANPDFGQVEVDPAVVNLTDVESYFEEKRPFFVENPRTFSFGAEGASQYWGLDWSEPRFFYSRRIGRAPQGVVPAGAEFRDVPVATRILGAAKLTGQLAPGFDFGTLHAVTQREEADYVQAGGRGRVAVEPATYYGVTRGLRKLGDGRHGLGFMTTLVQRQLVGTGLADQLNEQALVAGVDGWHFLDARRQWVLSGWTGLSRVAGTRARMIALQGDPRHYLQRPDAEHLGVDSSATSLTGYGARLSLNRQAGRLVGNAAIGFCDPRFDVNDVGYQPRADLVNGHAGLQYRFTRPNRWWRALTVTGMAYRSQNFDGDLTGAGLYQANNLTLPSTGTAATAITLMPRTLNSRRTRGGPLMAEPAGISGSVSYGSSPRGRVVLGLYADGLRTSGAGHAGSWTIAPSLNWKPAGRASVTVGPTLQRVVEDAQYLRRVADPAYVPADFGGCRYVFAHLDQTTVAAEIRVDVALSSNLTLQTYVQPFLSAGRYTDLKELARAGSYDFVHYGANYDRATGQVDPDGGGPAAAFGVVDPDFRFVSLRGNVVLRWEYRTGSVLYFVWTQERTDYVPDGELEFGPSTRRLLDAPANDVFMVKATYHLDL